MEILLRYILDSELMKSFANVLRDFRKEKGMSQETLAGKSSLDRTYVSLLECEDRKPSIETIFKLAKGLGCQPSDIIIEVEKRYLNQRENLEEK